jgi:hypothetical protein
MEAAKIYLADLYKGTSLVDWSYHDSEWTEKEFSAGGAWGDLVIETLNEAILVDLLPGINKQTRMCWRARLLKSSKPPWSSFLALWRSWVRKKKVDVLIFCTPKNL